MEMSIDPSPQQISQAVASFPPDTAVVMLNLLKYRDQASYPDEPSTLSGRQAYAKYGEQAIKFVNEVGGQPIWYGSAKASLIAPAGETWDKVILVRYPSMTQFIKMLKNPAYQAITKHRTAGLENSRLIAMIDDQADS